MAVSRESIDLRAEYDGVHEGSHQWTARWDIPEGEDPDDWREQINRSVIYDRLLEPIPDDASFGADVENRSVVVTASLPEGSAPQDPAERDALGAELIGLVQGLIGNFGVPHDPDYDV